MVLVEIDVHTHHPRTDPGLTSVLDSEGLIASGRDKQPIHALEMKYRAEVVLRFMVHYVPESKTFSVFNFFR